MLRFIESEYKCRVHRDIPGEAYIFGKDASYVREAGALVQDLVGDIKEGDTYLGEILEIKDFGALVKLTRAQEAILHISEISHDKNLGRKPVDELLCIGQKVNVQILQVDKGSGQVKVSRKALMDPNEPDMLQPEPQDLTNLLKAAPKFPVLPPRPWDRNFFRSKIATDAPLKKTKRKDGPSEVHSHQKEHAQEEQKKGSHASQLQISSTEREAPDSENSPKVWQKTSSQLYLKQPHHADNTIAKEKSGFSKRFPMPSIVQKSQLENKDKDNLHSGVQRSRVIRKDIDRGNKDREIKTQRREASKEIDLELVNRAFAKALDDAKGKNIYLSLLKGAINSVDPTFHERNFGFKSFSAFCEALHPHFTISKEGKDGSSVYIYKQELPSSPNHSTTGVVPIEKVHQAFRNAVAENASSRKEAISSSFSQISTLPRELHSTSSSLLATTDSGDKNAEDEYAQMVNETEKSAGIVAHEPLDLESLQNGYFGITSGLKKRKKPTARQKVILEKMS